MNFERKIEVCCEETVDIRYILQSNDWHINRGYSACKYLYLNIWTREVMPCVVQQGLLITHDQVKAVILLADQNIDACEEFLLGIKRDWQESNRVKNQTQLHSNAER